MVVGGFAIIEAGYPRFTGDIDLLIDASLGNEAKVFEALRILPDKAVNELAPGDVARHVVVRVADEVVVDLMANACGISYEQAKDEVIHREIGGVRIPFASPELLLKMKQTVREKDIADRVFLNELLNASEGETAEAKPSFLDVLRRWFRKDD